MFHLNLETTRPQQPFAYLFHKHAVAIGEEPVFFFDGVFICPQNIFPPGERRNQHQQGGFWQMEVGQQCANHAELKAWVDKDIGLAGACLDSRNSIRSWSALAGCELQSSDRRGPYGNYTPLLCERLVDLRGNSVR